MQFQTVPENYVGFDLLVNHADSTTIVTIVFPILLKLLNIRRILPLLYGRTFLKTQPQ